MARRTQPLRDEHRELLPHIETIRTVADGIGSVDLAETQVGIDETYEFLVKHLMPHAAVEDQILYPAVEEAMRAPGATETMRSDHQAIHRLVDELAVQRGKLQVSESLDDQTAQDLRRILYGLYALISHHFAKEELIYLPVLDELLTEERAHRLFEEMEHAA